MKLVIIFEEKNLRVIIPFHLCIFSEFISRASIGKREIKDFFFAFPGIKRDRFIVIGGILIWIILSPKKLCVSLYFYSSGWKILSINPNFRISTMFLYIPRSRNFLEKESARQEQKKKEEIIITLTILYFIPTKRDFIKLSPFWKFSF